MSKITTPIGKLAISTLAAAILMSACGGDDPKAMLNSAKEYLAKNDNKAAIIQLKNALQKQPNLGEGRFLLGKALLEIGDATGAEVELRKAKDIGHDPEVTIPMLAKAVLAQGKTKRVIDEFGRTDLTSAAGKSELKTVLSMAYNAAGDHEPASKELSAALASDPGNPRALLYQARLKAGEKDYAGAEAIANQLVTKDGKYLEARKFLGDLQLAQGNFDAALTEYRKALDAKATYLPAHVSIAGIYMRQGKLEEAGRQVAEMRKIAPQAPQTLFLDANLQFQKKDYNKARDALQQFHKVSKPNPTSLQLAGAVDFNLNSFASAEQNLIKALGAAPDLIIARRYLIGIYLRTGQGNKALEYLTPILDKINDDPNMLSLAGEVYIQQGDYKKAEEYYAKAAKLAPNDPNKQTRLALTHLAEGKSSEGFQELESVSAKDSGTVADLALVSNYMRRGEHAKALKALDVVEKKRPDDPAVFNVHGQILVAKKDLAAARQYFEKALKIQPAYYPAAASLASLDVRENKIDDAKRRFEGILAADSKNVPAQLAMAALASRTGAKAPEVIAIVNKAVASSPNDLTARQALVDAYIQTNNPKQAVIAAQEALTALPDSPEIMDAFGRAQLAAGDYNQALQAFGKLSAAQPTSPLPYLRMAEVNVAAKRLDDAIKNLEQSLKVKPDYLDGQRALVAVYVNARKFKEASQTAREIQKQQPKSPIGYLLEGDVAMIQKLPADAVHPYRAGLAQAPTSELAIKLNTALTAAGNKAESDKFVASWLKDHPSDILFRNHLAEAAGVRQEWAVAVQHYRAILDLQPESPVALNNVAWAMWKNKDPKAIDYAQRANTLAPNQPPFMDTLATLLNAKGDVAGAKSLLTKAVELAPNRPDIRLNLVRVLVQSGAKNEAKPHLETLAKLGDKFGEHDEVIKMLQGL